MNGRHEKDQLADERDAAIVEAARLRGELEGVRRAGHTIAVELATRAAAVGAQLGREKVGSEWARRDAISLRRLVAEHVVSLRHGMDPDLAVTALLDQLAVREISIKAELDRAEADRAYRDATAAATSTAADAADDVVTVQAEKVTADGAREDVSA